MSDESDTGDPMEYIKASTIWAYIETKIGTGGSHTRLCGVSTDGTITAAELTVSATDSELTLPTFSQNRYVAFAVPNTEGDITGITQKGTALNQVGGFTRQSGTVTVSGTAYKVWVSNGVWFPALSGTTWIVAQ